MKIFYINSKMYHSKVVWLNVKFILYILNCCSNQTSFRKIKITMIVYLLCKIESYRCFWTTHDKIRSIIYMNAGIFKPYIRSITYFQNLESIYLIVNVCVIFKNWNILPNYCFNLMNILEQTLLCFWKLFRPANIIFW